MGSKYQLPVLFQSTQSDALALQQRHRPLTNLQPQKARPLVEQPGLS